MLMQGGMQNALRERRRERTGPRQVLADEHRDKAGSGGLASAAGDPVAQAQRAAAVASAAVSPWSRAWAGTGKCLAYYSGVAGPTPGVWRTAYLQALQKYWAASGKYAIH